MVSDEGSGTYREAMAEPLTVNVNRLFFNELVFAWRGQRARIAELEGDLSATVNENNELRATTREWQDEWRMMAEIIKDPDDEIGVELRTQLEARLRGEWEELRAEVERLRGELAEAVGLVVMMEGRIDEDYPAVNSVLTAVRAFLARTDLATEGAD